MQEPTDPDALQQHLFEVEMKFPVPDRESFRRRLIDRGAVFVNTRVDEDTYYRHPCRDFSKTREALRIRRIDQQAWVTYKGPKQASDVKTRQELEWPLGPSDAKGRNMAALFETLGFERVLVVRKSRETFHLQRPGALPLTITLDRIDELGSFAEVETVVEQDQIERAQQEVRGFAETVGLGAAEPRSYLRMLLAHLESKA